MTGKVEGESMTEVYIRTMGEWHVKMYKGETEEELVTNLNFVARIFPYPGITARDGTVLMLAGVEWQMVAEWVMAEVAK